MYAEITRKIYLGPKRLMKGLQTTPSHITPRRLCLDYERPAKTDAIRN